MRFTLPIFILLFFFSPLFGQQVKNTSCVTSTGEKVLRFELEIPVKRQEAWKLFATSDGWMKWAAPVVSVDFKIGGQILTNYDKGKSTADPGTIRLPIVNYLEGEMLTLKVILTETFNLKIRNQDQNLQEIIQFVDVANGKTKIVSSMVGWGTGPDWDKAYDFFSKGNEWTYQELAKLYTRKST